MKKSTSARSNIPERPKQGLAEDDLPGTDHAFSEGSTPNADFITIRPPSHGLQEQCVSFRLRPGKKGLELRLHELEAVIMDVVWRKRLVAFAVSDVLVILEKRREIAYTTVMTTVARLYEKSLLTRKREGKRYLYSPKLTREQFLESTALEVLDGAVGGTRALAMLAQRVTEASAGELDELEALIRQRREELDRD